jgi:hypothetical protein
MATLLQQTTWHNNPRPVLAYASSVEDGVVPSPYYLDQRDVPVHAHFVTPVPLADLGPTAAIVTPGPALIVAGNTGGIWVTGAALNVAITVVGGAGDISTSITNGSPAMLGEDFATQVASALNTISPDVQCAADGKQVNISALGAVSALTITTWAVA